MSYQKNEETEVIKQEEPAIIRYEDSGVDSRILRAVTELGFESMTPIQAQAIPVFMEGRDIIGQAQTGTGKTAAFGIPILQKIDMENKNLQALILCPTRELAIQAANELRGFAKYMHGVKVLPIYGGQDITKQIRNLKAEVQIVVGTPGRVMDHMRRHTMKLEDVSMLVLDEADEMLNMGFKEDIETILEGIPNEHQMALFSATMPKPIMDITKNYQKNAVLVKVAAKELTIPLVKQYYYEVKGRDKEEVVCRLLDYYNPKRSLIFTNTKRMVDDLAESLKGKGYFAEGLHGDMSQNQRDTVMNRFRNGNIEILIATDVAARGIDVDDIEAVFNFDIPQDIEYYVHRIGRTGRAGKKGRAFTLVVGREIYKIREIENICKTKVKAKSIPSAADVTTMKAQKVMTEVVDTMRDKDLAAMTAIIEQKMDEEECTALELCAAFLKLHMGEELQDIPTEDYREKRYGGYDDGRRSGSRDGRGRGDRAKSGEKRSYGKSYGSKDGEKSGSGRSYGSKDGEKKSYGKSYGSKDGEKKSYGKSYGSKDGEKRSYGEKKSYGDKKKPFARTSYSESSFSAEGRKPKDLGLDGNERKKRG